MTEGLAVILLAAGSSQRMGAPNKLLLKIDGIPIVQRVAASLCKAQVGRVYVITGYEASLVKASLSEVRVSFIHNPDWPMGMGSTLARGVREIPEPEDGYLVCLADLPFLGELDVKAVVGAFYDSDKQKIVQPEFENTPGHPTIFPKKFREKLAVLSGDEGARALLRGEKYRRVKEVSHGVIRDLDTPESFDTLRKKSRGS